MNEMDPSVQMIYRNFPEPCQSALLEIRSLIYETAAEIPIAGLIDESLKWGQPTYSTNETKSGTPIRLDRFGDDKIAIFFHCQTTMIEDLRMIYSDKLEFSKNRAILLSPKEELPVNELKVCIEMALTYHKRKWIT